MIKDPKLFLDVVQDLVWDDFLVPAGFTKVKAAVGVVDRVADSDDPEFEIAGRTVASRPFGAKFWRKDGILLCGRCTYSNRTPVLAAATLAHELAHFAIPAPVSVEDGHSLPDFEPTVRSMGLVGNKYSTMPGKRFERWVSERVMPEYNRRMGQ